MDPVSPNRHFSDTNTENNLNNLKCHTDSLSDNFSTACDSDELLAFHERISHTKTESVEETLNDGIQILSEEKLESEDASSCQGLKICNSCPTIGFFEEIAAADEHADKSTVSQSIDIISQKKQNIDVIDSTDVDQSFIMDYINQTNYCIFVASQLRNYNYYIDNCRPDEEHFVKLDSSIKRNAAFVKKLRTFTGNQIESLLKDMASLNLSKYLSEVASALVECKLKMSDVWPAVKLCNILHLTYPEFKICLLENWQRILCLRKDDKISNPAKLRVDLRFYAELISVGIFTLKEGLPLLGNVLTMLINMDKEKHHNINIILSFCYHCGDDYAGLVPRKLRILLEKFSLPIPQYDLLPKEKQQNVKTLLLEYYSSLCKHRSNDYSELQLQVKRNNKILQTKGQLSTDKKEKLEQLQIAFQHLETNTSKFAEVLDVDVPPLPVIKPTKYDSLNSNSESEDGMQATNLWDDDESRCFYELLPNLKEFMPGLQVQVVEQENVLTEEALDMELDSESVADDDQLSADIEEMDDTEPTYVSNKMLVETFFCNLLNCVNKELIDSASVEFIMNFNSKSNRKKLLKVLFNVPRTRLDLIPLYARFVATLYPVVPDVGIELSQMLKQAFRYHIRKKDQMKIETKIKIVNFIGELIKFQVYSKIEGLYCLKMLIHDFTHHHIQMCCSLLETCGRYLFKHPDTSNRMKIFLEQIMRKKIVMALDSRHVMMIENAYYAVNPPDSTQLVHKERPPEHEFIRKILYQDLAKNNSENVLCLLRKLDWDNPEIAAYAVKCLTYGFKVKYLNIWCLANVVAGLSSYEEFVGPMVVDGVLEDIQLGMELNLPKFNQRRVAMIKYFGELYNYRMIESRNVFHVLYSLITFGVSWDHNVISTIDPPDSLCRIRLVCVLLDTCGNYFVSGRSKKNLDSYLVFFQHYYLCKYHHPIWNEENPFPAGIAHMFQETVRNLHPNFKILISLEESEAVMKQVCDEHESEGNFLSDIVSSYSDDNHHDELDYDTDEYSQSVLEQDVTPITLDENLPHSISKSESTDQIVFSNSTNSSESISVVSCKSTVSSFEKDLMSDIFSYTGSDYLDGWETEESPLAARYGEQQFTHDISISEVNSVGGNFGLPTKPNVADSVEDSEFQMAFEQMVSDNIQHRIRDAPKPQRVDIAVPLHIKAKTKKTYEQLKKEESETALVNFILLLKKGNKQQYKSVNVPVDSDMATNFKNQEEAERAEKERVKRLTLNMSARLEEEEYQEMISRNKKPDQINLNHDKRHKYHHQKGTPDTETIFGTKKNR